MIGIKRKGTQRNEAECPTGLENCVVKQIAKILETRLSIIVKL